MDDCGLPCQLCTTINKITNLMCTGCFKKLDWENYPDQEILINIRTSLENIKKIDNNLMDAIDSIPESFIQIEMLYLNATINNIPAKLLIDSGAQISIMSENVANICQIDHLIDYKCKGSVYGVGEQTILGKIHMLEIIVDGKLVIPCNFTILKDTNNVNSLTIIFGLDLLTSHGCIIDFSKREITISGNKISITDIENT